MVLLPDGRVVQLWVGGAEAGSTVFFLPGCPDCRLIARTGHEAARRAGVRLIAVNRPGYGQSTPMASGHLSVADDIVAVADAFKVDRFRLVGMSVGGPYALACAARHPERVEHVAVVGATADRAVLTGSVADAVAHFRPEFEAFVATIDPTDGDDEALAARWTAAMTPSDRVEMTGLSTADLAQSARESLLDARGYLSDAATTFRPWEFDLAQVRCPTSLWYGDEDRYVADSRQLRQRLPHARLTVLERTGHLAALTQHWDTVLGDAAGSSTTAV